MVAGPDGAGAARYTAATGRPVLTEALALYRLRWALGDLTIFAQQLLAPHDRTPATEDVWTWLTATISALADQVGD
jgi:spectinomycin phosphotransferase